MTAHLGGPETEEAVEARHARYLRLWRTGDARMFAIIETDRDAAAHAVGGIGWWSTTWEDEDAYEAGWSVVPTVQGRGIARAAVALVVADAKGHGDRRWLTARPAVDNAPSNALCAGAGFALRGSETTPWRGTTLTVNVWALDLTL